MSIKLPEIDTKTSQSIAKTKNNLLKSFQMSTEDFWKTIPTKIDPEEEREYLEEEVVAYLRTLLHRYNANQDWDRYNKVADIIDNIQNHNVTPDYLLKQILNAKKQEELNNELHKAPYPQQKLQILAKRWQEFAPQRNLTSNPNSKKLPPIYNTGKTNNLTKYPLLPNIGT